MSDKAPKIIGWRIQVFQTDRNPPVQSVEIDYSHPGYGNEPIWPEAD
jgi:hypothetical protein